MPGHDIIVIGASAGGVEALAAIARDLPTDLPAALFVVLHIPPDAPSVMPRILARAGRLRAVHPVDGAPVEPGHIYVAPPNCHLLVKHGRVRLVSGPRENGHRPAVDPLFRTAAAAYGRRVVGVVLSGNLDDGTAGLAAIKARGGVAIAQDPQDALFPGMPQSAVDNVDLDLVLPLHGIAPALVRLAHQQVEGGEAPVPDDMQQEDDLMEMDADKLREYPRPVGTPSGLTCPECHGALFELRDGELERYRCRTGHAFSADSLLSEQHKELEAALWTALRALEEHAALARRMTERARRHGHAAVVRRFEEQARLIERRSDVIRKVLREAPVGAHAESAEGVARQSTAT